MSLIQDWIDHANANQDKAFWTDYYAQEQGVYERLLEDYKQVHKGTFEELAGSFEMEKPLFAGFLDGINTSLKTSLDMEKLEEQDEVVLDVDFEKLYFNMLDAKASWLYELEQWNEILSEERRAEILKEYRQSKIASSSKVNRNDPCPCGSGKKYKKCCGAV
ncbi:SEC-C domain-containing protein [Clostridia bacterium OttesenSCG-928-F22]|nr:SEC-C domain-containing protein [Clostridia bacterium OttesenSCG-928-F22]